MTLSRTITGHHTVWLSWGGRPSIPVRYGTTDEELVCFGDGPLRDLEVGAAVTGTVHEIACGPPLESFNALVRDLDEAEIPLALVAAVHGNALDPQPGIAKPYEHLRSTRRFVGLFPRHFSSGSEPASD
jgi:hypothetical protein